MLRSKDTTKKNLSFFHFLLLLFFKKKNENKQILHKGKKLDMMASFQDQGVNDGAKLMMIGSAASDIEKVLSSRSDPTIRGFEDEKRLTRAREKGLDPSSSSAWRSEQHKEYKFSKLEVCKLHTLLLLCKKDIMTISYI
jgi:hypothetical protein